MEPPVCFSQCCCCREVQHMRVCAVCALCSRTAMTNCKNLVSTGKRQQVPVRGRARATRLWAGFGIVCLTPFPFSLSLAGQLIQWSTLKCSSLVSLAFWGRKRLFIWVSSLALHTQLSAPRCRECEAGIQCGLRKNHVTSKKAESFTLGPRELLLALGKKIFSWKWDLGAHAGGQHLNSKRFWQWWKKSRIAQVSRIFCGRSTEG